MCIRARNAVVLLTFRPDAGDLPCFAVGWLTDELRYVDVAVVVVVGDRGIS